MKTILSVILLASLVACEGESTSAVTQISSLSGRSADGGLLAMGRQVYQDNCVRCHGAHAEGDANWRKRDAQGNFPPPPLNGSGHTWHHPTQVLKTVIEDGSLDGKGNMPAWRGKLTSMEIDAVVAWFQSLWPQHVYDAWLDMQQRGR